ncbi:putative glycosyltransferase, type 1 [Natrialba magadii ATCC 43099]|uniref:Glycosyltransferase, type 1 n=1 Tax=Natrialba magadii (strain ATCC 43099 / DSM 3394 / CCM 3739 / CIP 104546 / IAM 13178 / JCM 8861 / NBRC 102185 / NCIMB 2190 / MS3) TaxID=547559 RepID=D3SXY0_NATMM|nr:glycosyltransferase family 4 protein [Natrialba magadii]ADD04020.1 putative glycosyltransferase, type 1 [Natrialba magadii ATCC 43099]ELY33177.1 group 1 glycosyl transferase [Natrialba magadii ATCC 43099]
MIRVLNLTTTAWRSFYQSQRTALESVGIEVTTLPVPGEHRAVDDEIRQRTIANYARYLPQVLREARGEYDLIHANYGLTIPFALAASRCPSIGRSGRTNGRLPVVCTLWGGEYRANPYEPLIKRAVARTDRVIVPSNAMAERVDCPCDVIPFPVDTEMFRPIPKTEARERVGWDQDTQIVLFPYAPSRDEKNFPLARRVVDGVAGVLESDSDSDSDADITLKTVANEPYEEMPYYLNAADAVILTSRFESGPMTVKEAAACNTPVVARDVGFAREVLGDVSNASVTLGEDNLVRDLARVLESGEPSDGREKLASYTAETMGERLRAVYEECLAGEDRRQNSQSAQQTGVSPSLDGD